MLLTPDLELVVWEAMELTSVLGRFNVEIGGGYLSLESLTGRGTFPTFSSLHIRCNVLERSIFCVIICHACLSCCHFSVKSDIGFS